MLVNFSVIYLIAAIIGSLLLCVYAWRNRQARDAKPFTVACLASVCWMFGDVVGRLSETLDGQIAAELIRYVGVVFLPLTMLVFVYSYCGKRISRRAIVLLAVVPVISWLVLLTNSSHQLFFTEIHFGGASHSPPQVQHGVFFWFVHLPYGYFLSLFGFLTVLLEVSRASRHYRNRLLILLAALCIPFAVNVIGVFKLFGEIGYTPLSFPITFSILAVAIFRYRFLTSTPIAYETVFKTIRDGVVVLDQNNIIIDINPAAAKDLMKSPREIVGTRFEEAFARWGEMVERYKTVPDLYDEIELDIGGKQHFISVTVTPLVNNRGTLDGRVLTMRDITDRKHQQFSLETLAFHDPLTRLANRRKFEEEVENALGAFREKRQPFAILYFDLNHFKNVNDTMGHAVGDELLKYVAARISSILRKPDLLARLGGDEFAAILRDCDETKINLVVERILDNVQRPFKVGKHTLVADLSIGAAFCPENGTNPGELLRHADSAMYQAKQNGGGLAIIHTPIEIGIHLSM